MFALYAWRRRSAAPGRRHVRTEFLIVLSAAALIAGWWYVQALVATGTITGEQQSVAAAHAGVGWMTALRGVEWRRAFDFLMISYIWLGGWSFLVVRSWMYHAVELVFVVAGFGLAMQFVHAKASEWNRPALAVCVSSLAAFAAGLCYQIISAYRSRGEGLAFGYYAYAVCGAEAICIVAGLYAVSPRRLARWVVPGIVAMFAVIELFGVCFCQMPYYAGLTIHDARGHLPALRLSQLGGGGFRAMFDGLAVNKPSFLTPEVLVFLWVLLVIGIAGLLWVSLVIGKESPYRV